MTETHRPVSPTRSIVAALVLSCMTTWVACGGDGVLGSIDDVVPSDPPAATLDDVQREVFTPNCALFGCHVGPGEAAGLNLSDGEAFDDLVGVASVELPQFLRVRPRDPIDSYLFMKITGDRRIVGDPMPQIGGPLTGDQIALVREWIDAGASED